MKIAGAPLGYGPTSVPGATKVCPRRVAMISTRISPSVVTVFIVGFRRLEVLLEPCPCLLLHGDRIVADPEAVRRVFEKDKPARLSGARSERLRLLDRNRAVGAAVDDEQRPRRNQRRKRHRTRLHGAIH